MPRFGIHSPARWRLAPSAEGVKTSKQLNGRLTVYLVLMHASRTHHSFASTAPSRVRSDHALNVASRRIGLVRRELAAARAPARRCPYQKSGTCCGRCRCGPGLIPSARACPRCSSRCSPPSSLSFGRVSSSGRRFSLSGINLPSCNARRRSARGWVTPIGGSGCSCLGCGGIGEAPFSWSDPTPSCDGIVAGSHATGAGDRRGDDPVDPPWLLTCAH